MSILLAPLKVLFTINSALLRVGRTLAWIALAAMVLTILTQVVFRYVLSSPLNWTEELARFLMLWMTGLIAPSGYRWGGFVAIDMIPRMLPRAPGLILNIFILLCATLVLVMGVQIGWSEITGFGGRFASPSLAVPFNLDLSTFELSLEWTKMAKKYMFASLWVCCVMMLLVNIELLLTNLISLISPDADMPTDPAMVAAGAD